MSEAVTTTTAEWRPRANPWLIALAVMLATFMVILDTSIAVVALPYIAGNLGATQDESTWVLTSYLVANAIILPASNWLSVLFGRKRFLIGCTVIFTVSSLLCGLATSMSMLVVSRVLQGLGGGAMQPLSQAILLESFPPAKRGAATALFGLAIVVAPILGPTLGGWLTDNWSWRWTFYINLPVGILAFLLMSRFVEDPPYLRALKSTRFDGVGFGLVAVFLGTLQIMLDKGQDADWFDAVWLRWFAIICVGCLVGFIVRELTAIHPLVDLRAFKNRNFRVSCIMFGLFGMMLYALIAIQPLFLQSLLGYSAFESGLSVCPRGVGALAALFFVGMLVGRVDSRLLSGIGFAVLGLSSFLLCRLSLQMSMISVIPANILAGFGTGCLFVPLTTLAVGTLRNEQIGNAMSLQNLIRNTGGSIGLSIVATLQERFAQAHQSMMVGKLSVLNPSYQKKTAALQHLFEQRFSPADALARAHGLLYKILLQQSAYWAFMDLFFLVACICAVCVFGIVLYDKPKAIHAVSAAE
ncbi:MAG TPA: DHA2 family efflux MFS transporter permease subunit [Verrucomicrobiae bacterium]|jgi:DHA2 family multidrug resistance protein